MSFTYIPNQTVLCDFCSSSDTTGIDNLYNAVLAAFNQAGVNVIHSNRLGHAIAIQEAYYVSVITMRLQVGFGVCTMDSELMTGFDDITSDADMASFLEGRCKATYELENCPKGSRRRGGDDLDNSYGYPYSAESSSLRRTNWAADGLGRKGLARSIPLCVETQQGSDGYLSCWGSRFGSIRMPCYGYGRVTFSVMCKDTGWALYIHQTRPYHETYDTCPDTERYGFSSVIFCDRREGHSLLGWVMPQPPSPKSLTRNHRPVSDMSFSVFYMLDFLQESDESYCIQRYGEAKDMWVDVHASECSRVGQYVDFATSNVVQSAPLIVHEFESGLEIEGGIEETEFAIDPEIISRANVTYNGKIYKSWSVLNSENQPRRIRGDGSIWEWGGNGFLHRVQ